MAGMYDVGKLVATLGLNTTPFMTSANGAMSAMQRFQTAAMATGRAMTRFVTIPAAIAGGAAIKMQKNFEMSMTKIIGLVGVSREQVGKWKDDIYNIARETGRGPEELADALYFVTSAGYRGSEALDILQKSAMAAAGGMGETKDIADLVTSAMYAYRKSNLSATEAMDAVVASVREGKVEVTDLINSMGKVFPIASQFNVSIQEVGATMAAMTRSGTEADKASTHLRAILNQMINPSQEVKKAMAGLQYTSDQFNKTLRSQGLIAAMLELNKAIKGDPQAYAKIFQNIRALTGVLDVMGDNMEENVRIFERMKNSSGSLKKVFEEVQGTTQFGLDKALANLGITAIELGEILKGPVVSALERITEFLQKVFDKLDSMTEGQKKATLSVIGFVAVVGPALAIISRFVMILTSLGGAVGAIAIVLGVATMAFLKYKDNIATTSRMADAQNDIRRRSNQLLGEETTKIKNLYKVAKDETKSKEARTEAIKEMQRLAPGYFDDLNTEKLKLEDLTDAYEDFTAGSVLKSQMDAANQAMSATRQAIMQLENNPIPDQKIMDEALTRIRIFANNYTASWDKLLGYNGREKLKYNQVMEDLNNAEISDLKNYLKILENEYGTYVQKYFDFLDMMAVEREKRRKERENEEGDAGSRAGTATGGYLFNLQENLKTLQEAATGASKEDLAVSLDKVRAAQKLLSFAELQSKAAGTVESRNASIARLQLMQVDASDAMWVSIQEMINGYEKMDALQKLMVDGFGAQESVAWDIANKEEEIRNAKEEDLDRLKEELRLLYEKQDVLNEMKNPYEEINLYANAGTKAWKQQYASRIESLNKWIAEEGHTHAQYMAWEQEKHDKEEELRQQKIANVAAGFQAVQAFAGMALDFLDAQKQKELKMAGDNEKQKEAIEKKYFQKQKKWQIAQALMNGALAITNILATVPAGPLNPAAWVAIAIAGATTAAQVALIASQNFAKGGLVYGETLARVGEYPGASSNPEVIAPLSDLKKMLKPMNAEGAPKYIELKLKGRDAVAMIKTEQLLQNTY